eukprot:TRINITY_DN61939_c0_g1_i1.p1 TRINITY_DN61939_c0_g1~~TRINITY_DN61939_c0_g1_i1.p1  ORF type:complete len:609 (-),score=128.71 TRINITY_DN61939_c0_g1_i1:356-2080(-)
MLRSLVGSEMCIRDRSTGICDCTQWSISNMQLLQAVSFLMVLAGIPGSWGEFYLNRQNTTVYGPAWSDVIVSYGADFVTCHGEYALCFYSNCTATQEAAWAPGVSMAECPCDKHDGLYMVMINAILDESEWRSTRERCPLGALSCPVPNTAPVCAAINNRTLFKGAPGVDELGYVSAYSFKNATQNPGSTSCADGPYAGCMTAPCSQGKDGKVSCQCPVATGPFQIGGEDKGCGGIPSGSYAVPYTRGDYALVPDHCDVKLPVCYQGTLDAVTAVLAEDTINCPGKNESAISPGTCLTFGYGLHLGKDPIFTEADIYVNRPPLAPTDFIERCESRSKNYTLPGKRALVITTSHGVLGPNGCTTCKPTGVASPEFTAPFYIFQDAGVNVTLASIQGGAIPIDTEARFMTHWDTRFWADPTARALVRTSPSIANLNFSDFDLVYMAGGWGAAWDLGRSAPLAEGITAAAGAGKVLGSVCHGALGFINASNADGQTFVQGRNMTAVTNRQIEQLKIAQITPLHPETELRNHGANFLANHGVLTDIDQSMVVVDGLLVTGQNQNSACETAQRMLDLIV